MKNGYSTIGNRIVVFENEYDANLVCIELENSLVFVDTGRVVDLAFKFRRDMEERFNKKASHLLITHYHFDHYGAMSVFKDVEIIAARAGYDDFSTGLKTYLTKETRQEDVKLWKEEAEKNNLEVSPGRVLHWEHYPKNDIFLPTKIVDDELQLGNENEKVIFKVTGGHSKCTAYVFIPSESVIHVSDNLATNPNGNDGVFLGHSIFFFRMGVSNKTIEILEEICTLPVVTVIPGHGPIISKRLTKEITKYLKDLTSTIHSSIVEGSNLDEIQTDSRFNGFYVTKPDYWSIIIQRQYNLILEDIHS